MEVVHLAGAVDLVIPEPESKKGGGERKMRVRRQSGNQTPFWNMGSAGKSGSHPLAYLQAPVSTRWRPPLRSFRSSGRTDPKQPGA